MGRIGVRMGQERGKALYEVGQRKREQSQKGMDWWHF